MTADFPARGPPRTATLMRFVRFVIAPMLGTKDAWCTERVRLTRKPTDAFPLSSTDQSSSRLKVRFELATSSSQTLLDADNTHTPTHVSQNGAAGQSNRSANGQRPLGEPTTHGERKENVWPLSRLRFHASLLALGWFS